MQQPPPLPRTEYSKMMTLKSVEWAQESVDFFFDNLRLSGFYRAVENISDKEEKSVFVRAYPKNLDANAEDYFHFMIKYFHPTLIRARNLYEDEHHHIISFDPVQTSLENLLKNKVDILVTLPHIHQVTNLSPMLIGCLKQIAKALDYIHSIDKWHGVIKPEEVFLCFGDISDPDNLKDARVYLPMRSLESPPFESGRPMTFQQKKDKDWKMLGHFIKKLKENATLNLAELRDLHIQLEDGVIKSSKDFFNHPVLWDPLQRSMFLIGVSDLLKNTFFWSNSFKNKGDWTSRYSSIIDLMPKDKPDNHKNPNSFYYFGKLVRNVVAHFDDPDKKSLKSIIGNDRGAALRYFQHEHPDLFPDLLVLARNCDPDGLNTLLDTINSS